MFACFMNTLLWRRSKAIFFESGKIEIMVNKRRAMQLSLYIFTFFITTIENGIEAEYTIN